MSTKPTAAASFTGPRRSRRRRRSAARALGASDDFFAGMENLSSPGAACSSPASTPIAASGWTAGRAAASAAPGPRLVHRSQLGAPGECAASTSTPHHFLGNHPPFASVDGLLRAARHAAVADARRACRWSELLRAVAAAARRRRTCSRRAPRGPVTHLRLNIFPDGGVARLRVLRRGRSPTGTRRRARRRDARARRGRAGRSRRGRERRPRARLLRRVLRPDEQPAPARAAPMNMGGGWETRRRRGPGHDWILVQARRARRRSRLVEVDTNHFKGNYPDRCSLEAHRRARRRAHHRAARRSRGWRAARCPRRKLAAAHAALLRAARRAGAGHARAAQHLSRRRREPPARLGQRARWLSRTQRARTRCRASEARGRAARAAAAPRAGSTAMLARAPVRVDGARCTPRPSEVWAALGRDDYPRGLRAPPADRRRASTQLRAQFADDRAWSAQEQARRGDADEATLRALRDGNLAYERASASSSSCAPPARAPTRCWRCCERASATTPDAELRDRRRRAGKITRLRLEKLRRHEPRSPSTCSTPPLGQPGARRRACASSVLDERRLARARRAASPTPTAASRDLLPRRARSRRGTYRLTFETGAYFAASGRAGVLSARRGRRSTVDAPERAPPRAAAAQPVRLLHLPRQLRSTA